MTVIISMALCAHYAHYVYTTCTADGRNSSSVGLLPPIHPGRQIDGLGAVNIKKGYILYCINHKFRTYIMCVIVSRGGGCEKEDEPSIFTYHPTSSTTKRHLVTLEIMP